MSKNIKTLLVLLGLVLIYWFYYSHSNKSPLASDAKCRTAGESSFEKDMGESDSSRFSNPEFKFAKDMDTCLYKFTWLIRTKTDGSEIRTYNIKDAYTNKVLASYTTDLDLPSNWEQKDLYDELDSKYFRGY